LSCSNDFKLNDDLFFEATALPNSLIRATPCFTDYFEKAQKYSSRHQYSVDDANVYVYNLKNMLLADEAWFERSVELHDWRRALDALAIDSEELRAHLRWLFRKGLSNEAGIDFYYSFCEMDWVKEGDCRHCAVCNKCYSVHISWHCGVCKQFCHNGLDEPCHRCGGTLLKAKPRPEDDFENLESEPSRARVFAPMHGETTRPTASQSGA